MSKLKKLLELNNLASEKAPNVTEDIEVALIELAELVDTAIAEHESALVELADIIMGGE